jgi:hypothetical protein
MLIDYDGWHNDDKSAIYSAGNGKSSNILGEVIE